MKFKGLLYGFLVVFIWSGWIIVSKFGLHQNLTPWDIIGLRFSCAAAVTLPLLLKYRNDLKEIFNCKTALCSLGCGFPYVLTSFWGLELSPAANAGVIVNGMLPVFCSFIVFIWTGQKIDAFKALGIVLVFMANSMLLYGADLTYRGAFWLLCAAFFLSFYSVSMRVWSISIEKMMVAVPWVNFVLFMPLWFFAPSHLQLASFNEIALQVLYQGVLVSVVALYFMSQSINLLGSVTASTIMALVPTVAAILAWLFLKEELLVNKMVAIFLCTLGILFYNNGQFVFQVLFSKGKVRQ